MPVIPRRITGMICLLIGMGSVPSAFQVSKRRKTEAIANRKKAAENGPTSFATTLPAINVPPQKIAVNNNFTYTNIVEPLFIFSLIHIKEGQKYTFILCNFKPSHT